MLLSAITIRESLCNTLVLFGSEKQYIAQNFFCVVRCTAIFSKNKNIYLILSLYSNWQNKKLWKMILLKNNVFSNFLAIFPIKFTGSHFMNLQKTTQKLRNFLSGLQFHYRCSEPILLTISNFFVWNLTN